MKVFIKPTHRRIQPFDDPIGEVPIQNRPLASWQAQAFRAAGLEVVDEPSPPCLVVADNLFTTGPTLTRFLELAAGRSAVLVLKRSLFAEHIARVQPDVSETEEGWRFPDLSLDDGSGGAQVDVVVDPEEEISEIPIPPAFTGEPTLKFGIPRLPVAPLNHWVHLLSVNQLVGWVELRNTPRWKMILRGLGAALRALSLNKWKVLARLNRIGRGCDIHPTAVVEGSTLGDDVSVGPFSHVQFSTLDDGVSIMGGATVMGSTLGKGAVVSEECVLRFSVLYPGAVVSQEIMQQCVLGRDVLTTRGGGTIDYNFSGDVKVPLDGKLYSTGGRFLGSAFGHRARIGTGILITCGRSIPNDYFLICDPKQILSQIPPGCEGRPLIASTHRATPMHLLVPRPVKRTDS